MDELLKSEKVIPISNLKEKIGSIAAKFYDYPSKKMTVIGITGTNGKTSCSFFISDILNKNNIVCGIIGTLGWGFKNELNYSENTTPSPILIQKELFLLHERGAQTVVIEASSHGLDQERTEAVEFDIAVFTNLSHDHLDYHADMNEYGKSKRKLFLQKGLKHAVINLDDEFGYELSKEFSNRLDTVGFSENVDKNVSIIPKNIQIVEAHNTKIHENGFSTDLKTPWGDGILHSNLLGRFNIKNLMATVCVLGILKIPLPEILSEVSNLDNVPGRMQVFKEKKNPLIVVDYAHTPDALKKVLLSLKEHSKGSIWCVFGCGGDRDRKKRALMGQIAEKYSDQIVITDDNPRTENPQNIIDDILSGLLCPWAVDIERDREAAIAHAIACARETDIVLIAGKGHENYQIIDEEKIPFSDTECVNEIIRFNKKR